MLSSCSLSTEEILVISLRQLSMPSSIHTIPNRSYFDKGLSVMTSYPPDPVPVNALPSLDYVPDVPNRLVVPKQFSAKMLLMPFTPSQQDQQGYYGPFFQLCTANMTFSVGEYLSLQIKGADSGTFWYLFTPNSAQVSVDGGTFNNIPSATGWTMPSQDWFYGQPSMFIGAGPMNWIEQDKGSRTYRWKSLVPGSKPEKPAANWIWCYQNSIAGAFLPKRMMFGFQPPTPLTGNPSQLPVMQNFSFSYLSEVVLGSEKPQSWVDPMFPGFTPGNPKGYQPFVWAPNLGSTALMTPVNELYDPLPTRLLYRWDDDSKSQNGGTRGQSSLLHYTQDNPEDHSLELALLTRVAPSNAAKGYNAYYFNEQAGAEKNGHMDHANSMSFPFGAQPPDWITKGDGKISGVLVDNPDICPGLTVNIWGALFPPSPPNYPDSTFLWTWYQPLDASGILSRPVVFMQSSSALGTGTSLALADYFYFKIYDDDISPDFFAIPPPDFLQSAIALRSSSTGEHQSKGKNSCSKPCGCASPCGCADR